MIKNAIKKSKYIQHFMKFKTTQDSFKKKNNATKFIIFSTTRNQGFTIYKKKKKHKSLAMMTSVY